MTEEDEGKLDIGSVLKSEYIRVYINLGTPGIEVNVPSNRMDEFERVFNAAYQFVKDYAKIYPPLSEGDAANHEDGYRDRDVA